MTEPRERIPEQIQQLCAMIHRAAFHDFHGGSHNPHRGQGRVLAVLKLKPEISQKELTYLLGTSRQSMAELLAKLEKNGLIIREPSAEDPRSKIVKLTDAGAEAADKLDSERDDSADLFDCLSADEQSTLSQLLDKLIQQFEHRFPGIDFEERRRMMQEFRNAHNRGDNYHHGPGQNHCDHPHTHGPGCGKGKR